MTDATTTTTGTTATTAATGATATGATTTPPWYEGKADAETIGWLQNKGWDKDPATGAIAAAQAHREAQKLIGVPPEQIVRWPKDASDSAGWQIVYDRLGVPKEAKDYDFSTVKNAAGEALAPALADTIRATAASNKLTKDAAAALAQSVVKHMDSVQTSAKADLAANVLAEREALDKSWGKNRDANLFVANATLQKLAAAAGMDETKAKAAWDALSKVGGIGAAAAMEMLRVVGSKMGEGRFVESGGPGGDNMPMTREAAIAEIGSLKQDKAFGKRLLEGGTEERKRWDALHKIGYGQQNAAA